MNVESSRPGSSLPEQAGPPRFAWRQVPDGSGPYLFLLHGMLSSHRQWTSNLDALARFSRPVLFDLWGHGDSPCPLDRESYELESLIEQIDRVRRELGADRVLLCGQSFGAGLMMRYAIAYPERVIALVITNSMSALSPPHAFGTPEQRAERAARIEAGGRAAIRDLPFHPRHAKRLAPDVRQTLISAADQVDPRAFARLSTISAPRLSVSDELHRLRTPTLLVNGRWEKSFQPLRESAQRSIADCRVADVEAGHAVNLENAAAFDEAVGDFFQQALARERHA
ncbi:MAG: alpha/beta fold hydrolase [Burkholderiaceae bacterium]